MKTIQSACICSQLLLLLLCGGRVPGQSLASHRMGQPERPPWVESDARLKITGNVNFQGVTLGSAVASLSTQTKVPLEVSPRLKDCRISIFAQSRPLSEILMRIQDLFHHGSPLSDHTCYWLRIADKGAPVTYLLTQSRLGLAEEEENAGVPVQKLAKYLRQTRQYIGIAPEKRRKFKSDFPFLNYFAQRGEEVGGEDCGTMCDLVGSLTDAEIEMLASTGRVDVPSFVVAPSRLDALIKDAKTSGSYRSNMEQPPSQAYLLFKPQKKHGWYSLELYFGAGCVSTSSTGLSFDTLDNAGEPIWVSTMLEAMEREEQGKPVDLFDAKDRVANKIPRMSIGTALDLWRKATGRSVYGEIFLREKATLRVTAGKPETLLTRICAQFGYDWRKTGDDYLVYSKSWGYDRAADIPDAILDKWSAIIKKEDHIPLETALEMAAMRDAQIKTMQDYLYVNIFRMPRNLPATRLLNSLSKPEREAAEKPGVQCALNTNDPQALANLAAMFGKDADFRGAALHVDPTKVHGYPAYTITVTLPSGESKYGFFTLKPPVAPLRFDQLGQPEQP